MAKKSKNTPNVEKENKVAKSKNVAEVTEEAPKKRGRKPKDPNAPPREKRTDQFAIKLRNARKLQLTVSTRRLKAGGYSVRTFLSDLKLERGGERKAIKMTQDGSVPKFDTFEEAKVYAENYAVNAEPKGWKKSLRVAAADRAAVYAFDDIPDADFDLAVEETPAVAEEPVTA